MLESHTLIILRLGVVLVILGICMWAFGRMTKRLLTRVRAAKQGLLEALLGAIRAPGFLVLVLVALNALPSGPWHTALLRLQAVLWIIVFALFLILFVGRLKQILIRRRTDINARVRSSMDIGTRIVQLVVLAMATLIGLSVYGIDVTGVIALGGIGGIIIGLAAKDALANIISGLIIFIDHPFDVGDWIICHSGGARIEGTVEEISWRATQIRTFDKRALYVPNSIFSANPVENPQRMTHRRIYETFGVRYCDAPRMHEIIQRVRSMLEEHQEIDSTQTLIVNFNQCNDSSLDFFIYTFTHTTDWVKFHQIKQDVLLKVIDIIHQVGADCAFPTRSVVISGDVEPQPSN